MSAQNENQYVQGASLSDLEIVSPQLSQRILSATYNRTHPIREAFVIAIPHRTLSLRLPARWLKITIAGSPSTSQDGSPSEQYGSKCHFVNQIPPHIIFGGEQWKQVKRCHRQYHGRGPPLSRGELQMQEDPPIHSSDNPGVV